MKNYGQADNRSELTLSELNLITVYSAVQQHKPGESFLLILYKNT